MSANIKAFKVLVIDDAPESHDNFMKILRVRKKNDREFDTLDQEILGSNEGTQYTGYPVFEIDSALQGEEGVAKVKQAINEEKPYSLAFVAIDMPPSINGIKTIKRLVAVDPDIQIVICTPYPNHTWEEIFASLGMENLPLILKKPLDNIAVRQLAFALTRNWQLSNEKKQDILDLESQVKDRTRSLQNSLSMIQATLESSTEGILVTDKKNHVIKINKKLISLWEVPKALVDTEQPDHLIKHIATKLEKPDKFLQVTQEVNQYPEKTKNGELALKNNRMFEYHTQPQKLDNKTIGRVWRFRDITQRIQVEKELEYRATHDLLTGLPNRFFLIERIEEEMARAKRNKNFFAILFFDLDRFKLINDSLSHDSGDEVLKTIAERVSTLLRKYDVISRIGGDEFVIVLSQLQNRRAILNIVTKLLAIIENPIAIPGHQINISASFGISIYPDDGDNAEELLRNADMAMYLAKESKVIQFQFYKPRLHEQTLQRLEMEADLRRAIKKQEFFLCYQPQLRLPENKLVGIEALIRWHHPKKGVLHPIDFVPVAEDSGLITTIGAWVLRAACEQNKSWQDKGICHVPIAVNISELQLSQNNFINMALSILEETGLERQYLLFELSENIVIGNPALLDVINQIIEQGIKVSFDDFGTGNSSLKYFKDLPINQLKIDQSFVKNFQNRNDEAVIRAIISMANNLDLDVIAEGVETQEQIDFLRKENCLEMQGFYFSKPLTQEEFVTYVRDKYAENKH